MKAVLIIGMTMKVNVNYSNLMQTQIPCSSFHFSSSPLPPFPLFSAFFILIHIQELNKKKNGKQILINRILYIFILYSMSYCGHI